MQFVTRFYTTDMFPSEPFMELFGHQVLPYEILVSI